MFSIYATSIISSSIIQAFAIFDYLKIQLSFLALAIAFFCLFYVILNQIIKAEFNSHRREYNSLSLRWLCVLL